MLFVGTNLSDDFVLKLGAADFAFGRGGDDVIREISYLDRVVAGAGDDTLIMSEQIALGEPTVFADGPLIHGGAGYDTVVIPGTEDDFTVQTLGRVSWVTFASSGEMALLVDVEAIVPAEVA